MQISGAKEYSWNKGTKMGACRDVPVSARKLVRQDPMRKGREGWKVRNTSEARSHRAL